MNELVVNGWKIFAHPLFLDQIEKLTAAVALNKSKNPQTWQSSANAKLLAALRQLIFETVPEDPTRAEYRQGGTLGNNRKHWFRVKFGGARFRYSFVTAATRKQSFTRGSTTKRLSAPMARRQTRMQSSAECSMAETHRTLGKRS